MDSHFSDLLNELQRASSPDEIYQKIISLGRSSPYYSCWDFQEIEKVSGCQSILYIKYSIIAERINFNFYSDALISKGLAALLVHFYTHSTPKEILTTPPNFLKELNFGHLLSPGRSNGLNSLYKKILEIALKVAQSS